jgi:protein phosphatase
MDIQIHGNSNVGLKRRNNEDRFTIDPSFGFCLVADGMGGAAAGELASQIFAEAAEQVFQKISDISEPTVVQAIQQAFLLANTWIIEHVQQNPAHSGMGCTAELFALSEQGYVLGHIGDSRSYCLRDGTLKQLTKDHSLIQEQIDNGLIDRDDARKHPMRNVILRAVGIENDLALDIIRGKIRPGDQYLLCSDGLTDMVEDEPIAETLTRPITGQEKADRLIQQALDAGGQDNVSVVLVTCGE